MDLDLERPPLARSVADEDAYFENRAKDGPDNVSCNCFRNDCASTRTTSCQYNGDNGKKSRKYRKRSRDTQDELTPRAKRANNELAPLNMGPM